MVQTILIVDDSMFMRNRIRKALQSAGYAVEEAVDGKQALEKCHSRNYDCVITDLVMPKLGGVEFLEQLSGQDQAPPAIVLTADIQSTTRRRCEELGAKAFLNKPVTPEQITEAIARTVSP